MMGNWVGDSLGVDSGAFISDLSNISIIVIGVIVNMLSTAIRESYRVRTGRSSCTIIGLGSIEGSLGGVISSSICWGSMMNNWGMVGRGSMDNWGSMDDWGSMVCWGSMVSRSSNGMMSSNRNNSGIANRDR